jgi:antimicrobial peptide system SdpB family protein
MVRVQVAAIYFHAAIAKFGVEDWVDGTAVYYFSMHPMLGASGTVLSLLRSILETGVGVAALTWGTLMLEYLLSAALFMPQRYWRPLLALGIAMHAGIIVLHGLFSFAVVMFGALVLFLRPMDRTFALPGVRRALPSLRSRAHRAERSNGAPELSPR